MKKQTGSINFKIIKSFNDYIKNDNTSHYYCTCITEPNTATKVINVLSNDLIQLSNGITITVHFLNRNNILNPKLDIQNGDIEKTIKDILGNELTQTLSQWKDNDIITFKYDGTYWRMQNSNLIEQTALMKSTIEQHAHSTSINQGFGDIVDSVARSVDENFMIEVPIITPSTYKPENCLGILSVKATGTESNYYILQGFDFDITNNEVIVKTYWKTTHATTANNVTISAKASYIKIVPFGESVRSPWANGTSF